MAFNYFARAREFLIIMLTMDKIRKEIHLPSEMLRELKIVAAHADKSVKKYIEDLVVHDVRFQIRKINRLH